MELTKLSSEELHLMFVNFLLDEVGQGGLEALYGEKDLVVDAANQALIGEPRPTAPVTNADGYALFLLPLVVTGRLDPRRAPETSPKVEAEFERYAAPWLKVFAGKLTAKAASLMAASRP